MGTRTSPSIVIIGTGFGGLGMAMELRRAGFENFTILERGGDVGGVWRENTYPGAACDVPSPLYSFSYEPNPDWSKRCAPQAEIHAYLRGLAEKHGLLSKIRFGSEVTESEYDDATGTWTIRTADGASLTADVLISAVGQLSRPAVPNIPGSDSFAGETFHSAEWNHAVDLTGKRVAVIGTGASAIQFVPAIQPHVEHMTVFQRSATWILPKPDTDYGPRLRTLFRYLPPTQLVERVGWWAVCETTSLSIVDIPAIRPIVEWIGTTHLDKQVSDPALRAKLLPDAPPGCKRGLFSNDWFPALAQPNVHVETGGITEITPTGVRSADGVLHEADVIIYGTGFKGTEFLWPMTVTGSQGRKLHDEWAGGARAFKGITVTGFPNLFLLYGPNTNLGAGSIVHIIESQTRYIRQAVELLAGRPGHVLDVRAEVEADYDARIQARLDRSVWSFCTSWYRNTAGRITNNWPGTVTGYRLNTRRLNPSDYRLTRVG
ncbi:NAD(P)/FAD-dependent oxidoreductase [Nocardia sp. 2]|uniref:NAD(P)/FAD-dependent oxidoreductase n=1 Tax=Nocardia acididurans TaxID=2802282 RepID=A0ABS1MC01_9NOCA|nr:NAD(P)/FAD-dependent oxidoreductase [Nocardia acididurans]MBL1078185.1 NAD(P)/FAD-dependent oxidoreductase [Nocardia acididurans]